MGPHFTHIIHNIQFFAFLLLLNVLDTSIYIFQTFCQGSSVKKYVTKSYNSNAFLYNKLIRIITCGFLVSLLRIFFIMIGIFFLFQVERFVDAMLFNMLILGSLIDESGYIFNRSETDLYIVETTLPNDKDQVRNLLAAIDIK